MTLVACLLGCDELGLWLADEPKRPGSRVIMGKRLNPYVRWIRECSGDVPERGRGRLRCATSMLSLMLLLNVDEITATIYEVIVRDEVRHAID